MSNEVKAKNLKPGDEIRDRKVGTKTIKEVRVLSLWTYLWFTDDTVKGYELDEYLQINE